MIAALDEIRGDYRLDRTECLPKTVETLFVDGKFLGNGEALTDEQLDEHFHKIPQYIRERLRPFQKEGVRKSLRIHGRVLIGDEMGLGKTVQAIAVACAYREDEWPLVVMCPASLKKNWKKELMEWLFLNDNEIFLPVSLQDLYKGMPSLPKRTQVMVVGYNQLAKAQSEGNDFFQNSDWRPQVIICDESHNLKSWTAQVTKVCIPIVRNANRRILLSGTAAPNRPVELHPQLNAINPKFWPYNHKDFDRRYCDGKETYQGGNSVWSAKGSTNERELNSILTHDVGPMVRRTAAEVLKDLPPSTRTRVDMHLEPGDRERHKQMMAKYKQLKSQNAANRDRGGNVNRQQAADTFSDTGAEHSRMLSFVGRDKQHAVLRHLSRVLHEDLAKGEKFLVYAHHKEVIGYIKAFLDKKGVQYITIDGSVVTDKRSDLVHKFQNNDRVRCAVLGITACNSGLTFTAASLCIFAELDYNPGVMQQCEGRIVRIGQTRSCELRYLIAPGTLEVDIWQRLQDKVSILGSVLDGKQGQNMAASKRSPGQPAGQQTLNFARASTAAEAAAKMFGNSGAKKKQKKRPLADSANQSVGASGGGRASGSDMAAASASGGAAGMSGYDADGAILLEEEAMSEPAYGFAGAAAAASGAAGRGWGAVSDEPRPRKQPRKAKRKSTAVDLDFEDSGADSDGGGGSGGVGGYSASAAAPRGLADQLLRDAAARDAREAKSAPRRSGSSSGGGGGGGGKAARASSSAQPRAAGAGAAAAATGGRGSRGRARGRGGSTGAASGAAAKRRAKQAAAKTAAITGGSRGFTAWLKDAFPLEDEIWATRVRAT
jgi:hypothetical protein